MPPPLTKLHLQEALERDAIPALERLAKNPDRIDREAERRFGRDKPANYASSTESDEEYTLYRPEYGLRTREDVMREHGKDLDPPLNDRELALLASDLWLADRPRACFRYELDQEIRRIDTFWRTHGHNMTLCDYFHGLNGSRRAYVIARRNTRKRWQKLGIWNLQWGIPGPKHEQGQLEKDVPEVWTWKWHAERSLYKGDIESLPTADDLNPDNPVVQAVLLRKGRARGEHVPVPPRSALGVGATAAEAETFITTRPWFVRMLERTEEMLRYDRIPHHKQALAGNWSAEVERRWKERGDDTLDWKWRHESPSPEPEDLTSLAAGELDLTPSEVDALEAIPPPVRRPCGRPRTPPRTAGTIPGWGGVEPPPQPAGPPLKFVPLFPAPAAADAWVQNEESSGAGGSGRGRSRTPPPPAIGRPPPSPPTRRSARIAAMMASRKRTAVAAAHHDPPSQAPKPARPPRGRRAATAAAAAPAAVAAKAKAATTAQQQRTSSPQRKRTSRAIPSRPPVVAADEEDSPRTRRTRKTRPAGAAARTTRVAPRSPGSPSAVAKPKPPPPAAAIKRRRGAKAVAAAVARAVEDGTRETRTTRPR